MHLRFLQRTFNLSGALFWGLLGVGLGVILIPFLLAALSLNSNAAYFSCLSILIIVFIIYGAKRKPKPILAEQKKIVERNNIAAVMSLLEGGSPVFDRIFPERITIGKFLFNFLFYFTVFIFSLYMFLKFPQMRRWWLGR
jgi:hypothetical protein